MSSKETCKHIHFLSKIEIQGIRRNLINSCSFDDSLKYLMTNDDSSVPFLDPAGDYGGKNWEGVKRKVKDANNIAFQREIYIPSLGGILSFL